MTWRCRDRFVVKSSKMFNMLSVLQHMGESARSIEGIEQNFVMKMDVWSVKSPPARNACFDLTQNPQMLKDKQLRARLKAELRRHSYPGPGPNPQSSNPDHGPPVQPPMTGFMPVGPHGVFGVFPPYFPGNGTMFSPPFRYRSHKTATVSGAEHSTHKRSGNDGPLQHIAWGPAGECSAHWIGLLATAVIPSNPVSCRHDSYDVYIRT